MTRLLTTGLLASACLSFHAGVGLRPLPGISVCLINRPYVTGPRPPWLHRFNGFSLRRSRPVAKSRVKERLSSRRSLTQSEVFGGTCLPRGLGSRVDPSPSNRYLRPDRRQALGQCRSNHPDG